jgi:aspartate/methionine/tyrosine aminotransferase
VPRDLRPTAWGRARAARADAPFDLASSNPTRCGFTYPHGLLDELRDPAALTYRPDPKGLRSAREAVAAEYEARGVAVDPERIVLTASSSEAYGFLFKILCDPDDAVLVPTPSYPLFEHLAALEGVNVSRFALEPAAGWQPCPIDAAALARARAAVLVHPNNPTGSWVEEVAELTLPLIVDEVFLDYPLTSKPAVATFAGRTSGLTFTLGGVSKSRGLPQLKLAWIVVSGPEAEVAPMMEALEFVGDSYLSVGTPVQIALPEILKRAEPVRDAILARCLENLALAGAMVRAFPGIELVPPGGGWSATLRFPRVVPEEELVIDLLTRHGVAVHPGYFFDFPSEGWLVVSLLPPPATFAAGLKRTLDSISDRM